MAKKDKKEPKEKEAKEEKEEQEEIETEQSEKEVIKKKETKDPEREKQEKALLIGLGVLALLGLIGWFIARAFMGVPSKVSRVAPPVSVPLPSDKTSVEGKAYRLLDGKETMKGRENPLPVGIMIENLASTEVRPQWGLSKASIVYETLAEGGITRFLAVFADAQVEKIGPIRSARPYYVDFAAENDSLYIHAGGSPEGLAAARKLGNHDVNALLGGGYFLRGAGQPPHNLYTNSELLARFLRDKKLEEEVASFEYWTFKEDAPLEARPKEEDAKSLVIDWSAGTSYDVRYDYDRTSNSYKRFHGDVPHNDRNDGEQIMVKNILVQNVPAEGYYASGKGRISLNVAGEGSGFIVKNGEILSATWKKPTQSSRVRFYDANGEEIPLVRGNTWVEVVPGGRAVLAE